MLTLFRLKEVLSYDSSTGLFLWKKIPKRGRLKGDIAGCVTKVGYRSIGIDGKIYSAHVLVWFLHHGTWPKNFIDHVDLDRDNNCFWNLREATNAQNQWNRGLPKNNTSGCKGVFLFKGRWMVLVQKNKKRHYCGTYHTLKEACNAQSQASKSLHGEFAHTS